MASADRLLPFVQLEFTHALGPVPGRYVVAPREEGGAPDVLVLDVAPGQPVKRRRRRGPREAVPAEHERSVPLALVTFIRAALTEEAEEWVRACEADPALQAAWVDDTVLVLNAAIRAHRAGCGDPYFGEITATDPRIARIGFGPAREVSAGGWTYAIVVEPVQAGKAADRGRNAPAELVAAQLGGRSVCLGTDELVLRALLDLDQGRWTCALLQLHAATRMLMAELAGHDDVGVELARRADELPAMERELGRLASELSVRAELSEDKLHDAAARLREIAELYRVGVLQQFRTRS